MVVGPAYYAWFASVAKHLPLWELATVAVAGMFTVSIVIGGGVAILAGIITKAVTGSREGSPHVFAWGAFILPILAFLAARYTLHCLAG